MGFRSAEPISDRIQVILVTDDPEHARFVLGCLASTQHDYRVTRVPALDTVMAKIEQEIEAARGVRPVIVMLDFEFLMEMCEAVVTRIGAVKGEMAIECLVTRLPAKAIIGERLRQIGAFLFDPNEADPIRVGAMH